MGERISMKLRSAQFENILRREIAFFDDEKNAIGDLTTRLSDDSRIVHKAAGESVARQIQAAFTLLLGLALGLNASWKVALVVLAVFPVNIAARYHYPCYPTPTSSPPPLPHLHHPPYIYISSA